MISSLTVRVDWICPPFFFLLHQRKITLMWGSSKWDSKEKKRRNGAWSFFAKFCSQWCVSKKWISWIGTWFAELSGELLGCRLLLSDILEEKYEERDRTGFDRYQKWIWLIGWRHTEEIRCIYERNVVMTRSDIGLTSSEWLLDERIWSRRKLWWKLLSREHVGVLLLLWRKFWWYTRGCLRSRWEGRTAKYGVVQTWCGCLMT